MQSKTLFANIFENFCHIERSEKVKSAELNAKLSKAGGPARASGRFDSPSRDHLRSMADLRVSSYSFPTPAAETAFYVGIEKRRDEFSLRFWENFEKKFGGAKGAHKALMKLKFYEGPELKFEKASCEISTSDQFILIAELHREAK